MRNKKTTVLVIACFALTIGSGILRGRIDHRWGFSDRIEEAAERLVQMPKKIGDWELANKDGEFGQLDAETTNMLRCSGNLVASYRDTITGQSVNVIFLVGPAGPLAQHTPDVCYVSNNYQVAERREETVIVDQTGSEHSFAVIGFKEKQLGNPPVRVYYSWNQDGHWTAPSSPKTAFAGIPMLYKIQVSTPHFDPKSEIPDAGERFLQETLPVLKAICE